MGEILSQASRAQYLYEPMNYTSGDKVIGRHFEVPGSPVFSHETMDDLVGRIRSLDLALKPGYFRSDKSGYRLMKRIAGGRSRLSLLRCRLQPGLKHIIWKDPIASLAAIAAAERANVPVLVTYRPPHAIAASFKRMGWWFDLADIAARARAGGVLPDLDLPVGRSDCPAINGALLSVMINAALIEAAERVPHIRFVPVNALLDAPEESYRTLFDWAGLPYGGKVEQAIRRAYHDRRDAAQTVPAAGRAHNRTINPAHINSYWRKVLSEEEAGAISEMAGLVDPDRLAAVSIV